MLNKELICRVELLNILNNKLKKHSICKDFQFISIQSIIPDGSPSCNWWEAELTRSDRPVKGNHPIASRIVNAAQSKYILK